MERQRLRDLAEMNFDRLKLLPLSHKSFGTIQGLPYPEVVEAALPAAADGVGTN